MEKSRQPDFINESRIRLDAGKSILDDMGESLLVGSSIGQFEKTPDDEDFLVKGELSTGENAGVLKNHKLKIEDRQDTSEHYMIAHHVLHLAGKDVPFDNQCIVCNPES